MAVERPNAVIDEVSSTSSAGRDTPPRIHVVGRKNSGKTTLLVALIEEVTERGLRVGTIKHTHHHHELDTPGKDSFRHRQAGSSAVAIIAPAMDALFFPRQRDEKTTSRFDTMAGLLGECDLVLVEGGLSATGTKIEVWRQVSGEAPLAKDGHSIQAIVTDDELPPTNTTLIWSRSNVALLADRVLNLAWAQP